MNGIARTLACALAVTCTVGCYPDADDGLRASLLPTRGDPTRADAAKRDAGKPDAARPEAGKADAVEPDAGKADAARPDAARADAARADAARADAARADAARPDGGRDSGTTGPMTLQISPLALTPAFDPAIHDYYLLCASGSNVLAVAATAPTGSTLELVRPSATDAGGANGSARLDVSVDLHENDPLVLELMTGGSTEQYWVRCLPSDFPGLELTLHPEAGAPTPGYYLIGPELRTAGRGYAIVMDGHGVPVWYHTAQGGLDAVDVENLIPGVISYVPYVAYVFGDFSTQFELHDLSAGTTSYVAPSGIPLDLHELRVLPNGNFVMIADPITQGVDLTGLASFGASENLVGCDLQEVTPAGELVWEWKATDHFDPRQDATYPLADMAPDGRNIAEVFHCNSIDVASNGDLLVSARCMDSVFLVSRATKAVVWKMGGATYSKDGAPYIAVQGDPLTSFYRQHDVRFTTDGNISMFDDQTSTPGPARAVIYAYDVASGVASVAWQYPGAASSGASGSFRIAEDGSKVIGWGSSDAPGRSFTELDPNDSDVLDFAFSEGDETYRAIKVPLTAFDLGTLRATAGGE